MSYTWSYSIYYDGAWHERQGTCDALPYVTEDGLTLLPNGFSVPSHSTMTIDEVQLENGDTLPVVTIGGGTPDA